MSLKDISGLKISASKIGKTSQKTELGGGMLSFLVKPTSPISKMQQRNRVNTGDTTKEIIHALTVKNSGNNTSNSNTDLSSLSLSASAPDG